MKPAAVCVLLFAFTVALYAADTQKIAIIEFQNKAGTIIQTNRWTMAEDLAKRLRKQNKQIQTITRKDILKRLNELEWNDERLNSVQEAKLADLGARYAIYGSIVDWRVHGVYSNTEVQDASEARVALKLDVIDLTSGNSIKSFAVAGFSTGETGMILEGDPASFNDPNQSDQQMYDATEAALIKAADILSEMFPK